MKNLIALFLILCFLCGTLIACGKGSDPSVGNDDITPTFSVPTEQTTAPVQLVTEPTEETTEPTEETTEPPEETTVPTQETEPPTEPQPTDPKPTEPKPTEPKPTEPKPTEPKPTQPDPTDPTEPDPTEPSTAPTVPPPANPREPVTAAPTDQTVSASFFDDAVFVGDSISLKLSHYAASTGLLGNAKFLTVGSLGVHNAVNDHPDTRVSYQGVRYTNLEEAVAATGAKKVFIMFGMNDIGYYGIDSTMNMWSTLLSLIRGACPDVTIYIQSMTPVWTGGEKGRLNNTNVVKYNEKLKAFASANGCKFINIHPYMLDSTGGLATMYCSDKYVHLTNAGAKTWIAVLKAYTGY